MASRRIPSDRASRTRRRVLLGAAVLAAFVATTGLLAYVTREGRAPAKNPAERASSTPTAPAAPQPTTTLTGRRRLPVPPSTHDPLSFGRAAAAALWSYDTRAYPQPALVVAINKWLTPDAKYADAASVDAQVPSAAMWRKLAANGQFALGTATEAHYPASFTQALHSDPGGITTAYVYAVTVTGTQTLGWNGAPTGGQQGMSMTLAVQCRPGDPCALAGVLPATAP